MGVNGVMGRSPTLDVLEVASLEEEQGLIAFPASTVVIRFAIRTLSICAMEMMFPWPRICVAAFMVISGVSLSEFSRLSGSESQSRSPCGKGS